MSKKLIIAASAVAGALMAQPAMAATYSYSVDNPSGSSAQGDITNFSTSYNDASETLSLSFTVDNLIGNAGWLAMSPGPNPKGVTGELALLYFDFAGGDIYAYSYSGENNGGSWNDPGDYIATFTDVLSTSVVGSLTTLSFSNLAVSAIQSHIPNPDAELGDWTGISFAEQLGIWFHIVNATVFDTNNGEITAFGTSGYQTWYDTRDRTTTVTVDVAEPSILALFGIGALAMGAARRRKKSLIKIPFPSA